MRKILPVFLFIGIAFLLFPGHACASPFGINITVWDKMGPVSSEDNEVEPNDVLAQIWDLEGFYLNGNSLTMIGGFNFLTGAYTGSRWFLSGDIFISTDPNAVAYGNPAASNGYNIQNQKNIFGYDYVLDMNYGQGTYQVYALDQNSLLSDVFYAQNAGSNPYRYESRGTPIGGVQSFQYTSSPDLTGLGLQGMGGNNFHNALTVDIGFLPENSTFLAHFTEECGNDTLAGIGATTPEPTTVALVAGGFLILLIYRRFKPGRTA